MFSKKNININCDVGEGLGNEHLLMPYISSCNIACGGHAGSLEIIDKVISLAKENEVLVGAHPSYPDRESFGRKIMNISLSELQTSIEEQITLLEERAIKQDIQLYHIKPHGALYNIVAKNEKLASIVLDAIENTIKNVYIYAPYNSVIANAALERGIKVKYEAFIDRNYNDDLSLVSRNQPNAIVTDKKEALAHLLKMINEEKIITINKKERGIKATTFCVHGDHENAVELLQYLNQELKLI
ncbi:5-oxoprolinase subunit PxpA [Tenacibaculum amylolyticum]|uniref:5-oxoprolinase subunit PxpA n=1 Tax=Tenacibaculum amylolyticum TaxID=104269 RepID=UPI003893FCB7